jgi:hypothetical protein
MVTAVVDVNLMYSLISRLEVAGNLYGKSIWGFEESRRGHKIEDCLFLVLQKYPVFMVVKKTLSSYLNLRAS